MVKTISEFWLFILRFQGAKPICAPKVLIWGFGGYWRFLTGVLHLDIDLDMITGLWYTHIPIFGSLSLFWRCKEHPCPFSPDFGFWRLLEVPDWGLHPNIDLDIITGLWFTHNLNFGSLSWFWRCKEHPCPLSPHLGLWRTLEVPDWGLTSCSWFGFCHESCLDLPWKFQHAQISKS